MHNRMHAPPKRGFTPDEFSEVLATRPGTIVKQ